MANAIFSKARQAWALGDIDWVADTIKVTLVDITDGAISVTTDQFFSAVESGQRISTATLSSKSATNGVLDAADVTLTAVTGDQAEVLVIWKDTGTESTSPLLIYIDTATGLAVTPNGGDINVVWDAAGIATL